MQPPMHLLHTMAPLASLLATQISKTHRRRNGILQPRVWKQDDLVNRRQLWNRTTTQRIAKEIIAKQLSDVTWFVQARCDDIIRNKDTLPKLAKSGLNWVLLGVENSNPATLDYFNKGITPNDAKTAVKLLRENGIFAHAMVIIGNRKETQQSIQQLQEFANDLDPDFIMFGILTPFPGTESMRSKKQRMDRRHQLEPLRHDSRHHANRNTHHTSTARGTLRLLPRLLRLLEQTNQRPTLKKPDETTHILAHGRMGCAGQNKIHV